MQWPGQNKSHCTGRPSKLQAWLGEVGTSGAKAREVGRSKGSLWVIKPDTDFPEPLRYNTCPREALTLFLGPQDWKPSACPHLAFLNTLSVYEFSLLCN